MQLKIPAAETFSHWIWSVVGAMLFVLPNVGLAGGDQFPWWRTAYEPQPIVFSHKLHATTSQIPCQYCHSFARRSFSSGVATMGSCVGCHGPNEMKLAMPDKPESNKVRDSWARQEYIPWVKIHDLPDYVRFPHKNHVNADATRFREDAAMNCDEQKDPRSLDCKVKKFKMGDVDRCEACHGDVRNMDETKVVDADFAKMGWCLACHLEVKGVAERKSALSTIGGWFNAKEQEKLRESKIQLENPKGYHNPNLTDCWTCHY
ncbi:cytochrome c3 family protein [Deltaproteobacteria bacterium TL4]